jgi:hypothetical protein
MQMKNRQTAQRELEEISPAWFTPIPHSIL